MKTPVVMSWSGGKDSALALHALLLSHEYEVVELMTAVSEEFQRVSHHGVRIGLLEQQAEAIGLPLAKIYLPSVSPNEVYQQIMGKQMASYKARAIDAVAFGDLFLEDLRAWRENNLAKAGMRGIFPLWRRDTAKFARDVIAKGFRAYLSCVEGKVSEGFVGRAFDQKLLDDLPPGIDPCGEYGEFHTFVYDGPIFKKPVNVRVGIIVTRDGRYYADLLPEGFAALDCDAQMIPPV
jgi:uncharacterized protein (TIGR00290 family)